MANRGIFGLAALAAACLWTLPVLAAPDVEEPVAVVELFTSQGCSSCRRANALLDDLAMRGDVVALAFHVDYWDYLGWKDTLAKPDHAARQRDYASMFGNRSVYTPQIVINGSIDVKGSKPGRVESALRRAQMGGPLPVDVKLSFASDSLVVDIGSGPARGDAAIVIVYFDAEAEVVVGHGQNRGHTQSTIHPVTGFHSAGMWHGEREELRLPLHDVQKKGNGGVAVLVQEINANGLAGAIRGAALIHHRPGS